MALIKCPECGKIISDRAAACPHCGNPFAKVANAVNISHVRRTELSEVRRKNASGFFFVLFGATCSLGSIFLSIFGVFTFFFGLVMVGYGIGYMIGIQEGTCPYCKQKVEIFSWHTTCKCPHCNKTSSHQDMYLEAVE